MTSILDHQPPKIWPGIYILYIYISLSLSLCHMCRPLVVFYLSGSVRCPSVEETVASSVPQGGDLVAGVPFVPEANEAPNAARFVLESNHGGGT